MQLPKDPGFTHTRPGQQQHEHCSNKESQLDIGFGNIDIIEATITVNHAITEASEVLVSSTDVPELL